MKRKLFAAALALLLALSLAACSKVIVTVPGDSLLLFNALRDNSGAAAAPAAETPATDASAVPAAASTDAVSTTAAPAGSDLPAATSAPATNASATNAPTSAAPAQQPASNGAPTTKEEIVNYYVTAYNKIAKDAKTIIRTYDYTKNYKGIVEVGGNERLAGLAQTLMEQFMKEDTSQVTGDINALPPKNTATLSMSAADVSTATCADKGNSYEIVLKSTGTDSNMELDCQPGQGSAGKIGPLLRTEDVSGAAGAFVKFEGLHAKYPTGQVTATIDKASGHITELKFACPCILHFDKATAFIVVTVNNTELGLEFLQNWSITY